MAVLGLIGVGTAVEVDWLSGWRATKPVTSATPTDPPEPPASSPGLSLDVLPAAPPVLDSVSARRAAPVGVEAKIRAAVARRSELGRSVSVSVAGIRGRPLWGHDADDLVIPASTLKLLIATAALSEFTADHTFETTVVTGRRADSIVLVGGGDPLLTTTSDPVDAEPGEAAYPPRASLQELARDTAASLDAEGVRRVRLGYDSTLFRGPAVNPAWKPSYVSDSVVSPTSALWVDEGRVVDGYAQRVSDPAREAADRFVTQLRKRGIRVVGAPSPAPAPTNSVELAAASSPTMAQIVQQVLEASDNDAAEVLLRQLALASGRPGTTQAGARAVETILSELGIDMSRVSIVDGSGLARTNQLSVEVLVDVLQTAAAPGHPELRPVVSSLPVAGFTGSLSERFLYSAPDGLGLVRAKTGTLDGVHGLAGVVVTADGGVFVFALVANEVPLPKTLPARDQLDRIAALLTDCGCG